MVYFIDTDPGCDDILALIYLIKNIPNEVVGVSCLAGNVDLDSTIRNARLIVGYFNKEYNLNIPVFKGASKPILDVQSGDASIFHGNDGSCNFFSSEYYNVNKEKVDNIINSVTISGTHAAIGLIEMSKKYNGELIIIALGPLTNIALAQIIDPEFQSRIKEIFIMGGSLYGRGNSEFHPSAEYNFDKDPESAFVVLKDISCKKTILPLEPNIPVSFNEEIGKRFLQKLEMKTDLLTNIFSTILRFHCKRQKPFRIYDLMLAIIILHPDFVTETLKVNATIELNGLYSRGSLIIDHFNKMNKDICLPFREVNIISSLDSDVMFQKIETFIE